MAILFIGPHRNPDFQSDYQLSPILAPDHLLAQFPPLLMTCGEKDPFVDDTLIFAGRVREAKRARRAELERIIAGKSSQFGEELRMSMYEGGHDQAMRASQPAVTPTQRKPYDARMVYCTRDARQPVLNGRAVDISPRAPPSASRLFLLRVDLHPAVVPLQRDDQAPGNRAGAPVAPTVHCDGEVMLARVCQCELNIGFACALRDHGRGALGIHRPARE